MTQQLSRAREALDVELRALVATIQCVGLDAPAAAAATLEERHPCQSEEVRALGDLCREGIEEGWLALPPIRSNVRQGCVNKDLVGYAISAVVMEGHGRGHTHPEGEIALSFVWSGQPLDNGRGPGWRVFSPGSHHEPDVVGGAMLFLYFRPHGEVVWEALEGGPCHPDSCNPDPLSPA